jgi:parvulin-like peptidyl-prolyl isomerase
LKFKCKHILLSHKDAENSTHDRPLGDAMRTAEELIVDLKKGDITWEEAAREHSACASGPRQGGDLGWNEEEHFHPAVWQHLKCSGT